jgi:hypothetical protein
MKTFHEFVWMRMPTAVLLREISELSQGQAVRAENGFACR